MPCGGLKAISRHSARPVRGSDHVANLGGFQRRARNTSLLSKIRKLREARELESPAHTPELPDFSRKLLLILIQARSTEGTSAATRARPRSDAGISPQHFPQRLKFQNAGAAIFIFCGTVHVTVIAACGGRTSYRRAARLGAGHVHRVHTCPKSAPSTAEVSPFCIRRSDDGLCSGPQRELPD